MAMEGTIFVTGGAGFIGANFVADAVANRGLSICNLDKLTYAGNLNNLVHIWNDKRHTFVEGDICDAPTIERLLHDVKPRAIVHFAAESHVDRSIHEPGVFIKTNVLGTFTLLETALQYWRGLPHKKALDFRFLHVSTDEVYGSLDAGDPPFKEESPYQPNSPYAASKASSDHLVRSYFHTYGLPTLTTNCSNNYGPFQFPEKLIPLMILNCLQRKPLPVYGDGLNVRDWLHVSDHCAALHLILNNGMPGGTYNIGGNTETNNIQVVRALCRLMKELDPNRDGFRHEELIAFVPDRPGHDRRYAIDTGKIRRELGWDPTLSFESGLRNTIAWYLNHREWVNHVVSGEYRRWITAQYGTGR